MKKSSWHGRLVAVASLAATFAVLSLPSAASAGTWGWEGYVGVNPYQGNGQCVFYVDWSACGPWNYWYQVNAANEGGEEVHSGFEVYGTIRGAYLFAGDAKTIYCWDENLCVYNKSETTFCTWSPPCSPYGDEHAYVWFRGYA